MAKTAKKKAAFLGVEADLVVGLDLSLESPGWALWNKLTGLYDSGFIDVKKLKIDGMPRLRLIRTYLIEILAKVNKPDDKIVVFIEGYAFAAKGRGVISLGELGGVIRLHITDNGGKFFEIPPSSLKKFIMGKGTGDKAVMLKDLYKRYGHDINQNDEGDAVCLVELGRACLGIPSKPLVQFQQEVLSAL
jgi:Holliday junction resolvasome RuvABC endonuclease subunit